MISRAIVSGGFDPVHSGHVAMVGAAGMIGPVIVLVNSDEWLARKKGRAFMPIEERLSVMGAMRGVLTAQVAMDDDGTVVESLRVLVRTYPIGALVFCNGGDRTEETTPEQAACLELGIQMAWGVGGGKTASSSDFLRGEFNAGLDAAIAHLDKEWPHLPAGVRAHMIRRLRR